MTKINWARDRTRRQRMEVVKREIQDSRNARIDTLGKNLLGSTHTAEVERENPKLRTVVMEVTPKQATEWLEGNTHNRPLRQRDVDQWAQVMLRGGWVLNGESIIFDRNGKLLDGQHRLWACVESETSFQTVVVFGADPEAFTTIDQGRHRSPGDHLVVARIASTGENPNVTAAAARMLHQYRNNSLLAMNRVPPEELIGLLRNEPELVQWVQRTRRAPRGLRGFATPVAVTLHIGANKYPNEAQQFLDGWVNGVNLEPGSPILTLRQRVLNNPATRSWERLFQAASAWNAFVKKRPLLKMGSPRGDNFPKIEGDKS